MRVDREEARRIARLAHLAFDDQGLDRMAGEMSAILDYIDQLAEVDVTGFDEDSLAPAVVRPDAMGSSVDRAAIAANAPDWDNDCFVVPKIIGGE